jgi:hypothetical protein
MYLFYVLFGSGFETRAPNVEPLVLSSSIMDSSIDYGMDNDVYNESQESEQQTQSTQQASQSQKASEDAHLWGYMQPCNASLTRIDFWKIHPKYTIGRNTELNQVILPGFKVSK